MSPCHRPASPGSRTDEDRRLLIHPGHGRHHERRLGIVGETANKPLRSFCSTRWRRGAKVLDVHRGKRLVTWAGDSFESRSIEYGQFAATVANEALCLESSRRFGDACAPHAEHVGEEFVRQSVCMAVRAILTHQKPSCQTCVKQVKPVARCGLRQLGRQDVQVPIECLAEYRIFVDCSPKPLRSHAQALAFTLDQSKQWGGLHVEEQRNAEHSFIAHHADFDTFGGARRRDQRDVPGRWKINVAYRNLVYAVRVRAGFCPPPDRACVASRTRTILQLAIDTRMFAHLSATIRLARVH